MEVDIRLKMSMSRLVVMEAIVAEISILPVVTISLGSG